MKKGDDIPRCFRRVTALSGNVVCMRGRQINAALSAMRNKADENDARGIGTWVMPA